jgi:hypothetical protein
MLNDYGYVKEKVVGPYPRYPFPLRKGARGFDEGEGDEF